MEICSHDFLRTL